MLDDVRARLDRDFSDFNHPWPGLELESHLRDFIFESFAPSLPAAPTGNALAIGLQHAREVTLMGRHFQYQRILNPPGHVLDLLAYNAPDCAFDLAFGPPDALSSYGIFDAAFCLHSFNNFTHPEAVLAAAWDVLPKGGKLFTAVQNAGAGSRRMALSMGLIQSLDQIFPNGIQKRFLDLNGLRSLVQNAGFKVVDTGGVLLKTFTEAQIAALYAENLVGTPYLRALYMLGRDYPELCASVYVVAEKP
ncbi:MAG: methyltransferase domain-containing protein [Alphaproteobacteria bacterium]